MNNVSAPKYDSQLLTGIQVALGKARGMGYSVEEMNVTASVSNGTCQVRFVALPSPGMIVAGGDISLSDDLQSKEISKVVRGQ